MEGELGMNESCERRGDLLEGACFGVAEKERLELRLGPPGDRTVEENNCPSRETGYSLLSLGYLVKSPEKSSLCSGAKRGFSDTFEAGKKEGSHGNQTESSSSLIPPCWTTKSPATSHKAVQQKKTEFLQLHLSTPNSLPGAKGLDGEMQKLESKGLSPAPASVPGNPGVPNNSHNRASSSPVVGWPPIRPFRKNLNSGSSKKGHDSQDGVPKIKEKTENGRKGMLIKINMDGIPIGRKVDLQVYDSYEKLSSAVDELFRGLLRGSLSAAPSKIVDEKQPIEGLLDGSSEYTFVYEDNEGDRMLVGDVPWNMFITSVKRLRVLKTSDLSAAFSGNH